MQRELSLWRIPRPLPAREGGEEWQPEARPEPDAFTRGEVVALVGEALPVRDAEVVLRHFGLLAGREETLAEIARHLGVSRERVRQRLERALRRLRPVRALEELVAGHPGSRPAS
jgi:DNA-directed RNA polymerase specialized sigma24 family protein